MDDELQQRMNESVAELVGYLSSDDETTRLQVLMALMRIENLHVAAASVPRLFNAVVVMLFDKSAEARTLAAVLLGRFDDARGIDPLMHCIADVDEVPTVRNAALASMMEFSELPVEVATELHGVALLLLQNAIDDELRATAAWVLGRLPADAQSNEALLAALNDSYEWVRKYAEESLNLRQAAQASKN